MYMSIYRWNVFQKRTLTVHRLFPALLFFLAPHKHKRPSSLSHVDRCEDPEYHFIFFVKKKRSDFVTTINIYQIMPIVII